jgi:4-hydroxybenzoate polyprenyltransferase
LRVPRCTDNLDPLSIAPDDVTPGRCRQVGAYMSSTYEGPSADRRQSGQNGSDVERPEPSIRNSPQVGLQSSAGDVHSPTEAVAEKQGTVVTELRRIFIHIRWPVQSYVLLGFLFGSIIAKHPVTVDVVLGLVSWFLICAGLTVFNSYYDKDEDPVGGMAKPPKVTSTLLYGSLVMQAAGLVLAIVLGGVFLYLAIAVIVLYILYSHRLFRFKSNGYAAVLINSVLGALTILAAASLGPKADTAALVLAAASAAVFKASVYMMMQVHQIQEDKARGDVSVAVMFGRNKTLRASLFFAVLAGACGAAALATTGAYVLGVLVLGYFVILGHRFALWIRQPEDPRSDYAWVRQMVYLSGYLGSVICLGAYIYFNVAGFN